MSAEQVVKVTCISTKTEKAYDIELQEKNVTAAVYIPGIQGPKGDPGETKITTATITDIENLFN